MIYLDEQGVSRITAADSALIKSNERFRLTAATGHPRFYNLHMGDGVIIPLLLEPGDRLKVSTSVEGFNSAYSLEGSGESQKLFELNQKLAETRRKIDSLQKEMRAAADPDEAFQAAIGEKYREIIESQRRYSISHILNNMTSMTSIYALYQKINDADFVLNENRDIQMLKITAAALDTLYPESEHVRALKQNAAQLEQELYSRRWQDFMSNAESSIPDIRLPDAYGDTVSLSGLNGNVVLLSFWASWNAESVDLNLDLKNLYLRYHDRGFEIFQVSFDNVPGDWMEAIEFDELPWINVSELSYPESYVAGLYNVQEIPTTFLIDREGKIIGRDHSLADLRVLIPRLLN